MSRLLGIRSAAVSATVLMAMTAAACTTTSESGGDGDGKEFTYWSMWTQTEPQAKVLQESIDEFTRKTGIEVNVEWQGRKVLDKVAPALLTGDAPDLIDQSFDRLHPVVAVNGQAKDLSSVLDLDTGEGVPVKEVIPGDLLKVLPEGKDGTPWMIPYEVVTVSLFYNGNEPLAQDRPDTWEEFLAICEQAKAADKACIGTDADAPWATLYWYDYLLNRNGGSLVDLAADKSGKAWDDPAALRAAEQIEQLVDDGHIIAGYDATKYPAQQNNWASGKSLYYLMGSWLPSETQTFASKEFEYRSIDFPTTGETQSPAIDVIPFGFSIPKQADNAEAAEKFIAHFLQRDQLEGISTTAANMVPRHDIAPPEGLADAAASFNENPVRLPMDGLDADYQAKALEAVFTDLWLGKTTASEFVDAAAKASASYWKARG